MCQDSTTSEQVANIALDVSRKEIKVRPLDENWQTVTVNIETFRPVTTFTIEETPWFDGYVWIDDIHIKKLVE